MERERERGHDFHGSPRGLPWKDSGGLPAPAAARSGVGATATRGTNATWIIILGSTVGDLWDREEGRERGEGRGGGGYEIKGLFPSRRWPLRNGCKESIVSPSRWSGWWEERMRRKSRSGACQVWGAKNDDICAIFSPCWPNLPIVRGPHCLLGKFGDSVTLVHGTFNFRRVSDLPKKMCA